MPKVTVTNAKGLFQESGSGVFLQGGPAGTGAPAFIALSSEDGTVWYLFVEDDGTLKIHNALPTANADGDAVGDQTD